MKKIIASSIIFFSSFMVAQAVSTANTAITTGSTNVNQLSNQVKSYFNLAIELMIAAAFLYVVWSAFKFATAGGDEDRRKEGQQGIIYGVIGVVVMLSVWGLVALVTGSTGLTGVTPGTTPLVN